jgi:hypothetical protein
LGCVHKLGLGQIRKPSGDNVHQYDVDHKNGKESFPPFAAERKSCEGIEHTKTASDQDVQHQAEGGLASHLRHVVYKRDGAENEEYAEQKNNAGP